MFSRIESGLADVVFITGAYGLGEKCRARRSRSGMNLCTQTHFWTRTSCGIKIVPWARKDKKWFIAMGATRESTHNIVTSAKKRNHLPRWRQGRFRIWPCWENIVDLLVFRMSRLDPSTRCIETRTHKGHIRRDMNANGCSYYSDPVSRWDQCRCHDPSGWYIQWSTPRWVNFPSLRPKERAIRSAHPYHAVRGVDDPLWKSLCPCHSKLWGTTCIIDHGPNHLRTAGEGPLLNSAPPRPNVSQSRILTGSWLLQRTHDVLSKGTQNP